MQCCCFYADTGLKGRVWSSELLSVFPSIPAGFYNLPIQVLITFKSWMMSDFETLACASALCSLLVSECVCTYTPMQTCTQVHKSRISLWNDEYRLAGLQTTTVVDVTNDSSWPFYHSSQGHDRKGSQDLFASSCEGRVARLGRNNFILFLPILCLLAVDFNLSGHQAWLFQQH